MQMPQPKNSWFFVDEAGDPTFYDRHGNLIVGQTGCSPILILGFIQTSNPQSMRQSVLKLQQEITNDPALQTIPSLKKTKIAFHAKDDTPVIRERFFTLLATLDFDAQFIVARKIERVFRNNFKSQQILFYDYLVSRLFEKVLHRHQHNYIYFAKRGSRERQIPLSTAIQNGVNQFERKFKTHVTTTYDVWAQTPIAEPCLSITDYMNWAVYRAFTKREMQYYRMIEDKVSLLVDWYDSKQYPKNWYNRKNPFDIIKTTPL